MWLLNDVSVSVAGAALLDTAQWKHTLNLLPEPDWTVLTRSVLYLPALTRLNGSLFKWLTISPRKTNAKSVISHSFDWCSTVYYKVSQSIFNPIQRHLLFCPSMQSKEQLLNVNAWRLLINISLRLIDQRGRPYPGRPACDLLQCLQGKGRPTGLSGTQPHSGNILFPQKSHISKDTTMYPVRKLLQGTGSLWLLP